MSERPRTPCPVPYRPRLCELPAPPDRGEGQWVAHPSDPPRPLKKAAAPLLFAALLGLISDPLVPPPPRK